MPAIPCDCGPCSTWVRTPSNGFAARSLSLPGALLTWSTWDGAWLAWLPVCEEITECSLASWCERVGVEMPTGADLAWLAGEGE